jgi:dihydrofolate reductase|tara:strand:- start:4 stop:546 length:543 start_codon:yes stop_codon:yes gene_type:complete
MSTKTSVYITTSHDGFIARTDGSRDWLEHDAGEDDYGFKAFMDSIDSMVLGRTTYQQFLSFDVEWPYVGKHVIVPSSTLTNDDVPEERQTDVDIVNTDPAGLLTVLATQGYKHAWIDGGKTVQSFLNDGLIDEITVSRIPVLIGQGIPLFGVLDSDMKLNHVDTVSYASGVVQSKYRVVE